MIELKMSVVIPVYNCCQYISECIESVISQSYKNIELIIINDGSTDGSLEIIKSYALNDDRIRLIDQANLGASSARNRGIDSATGEYIMFIDSDDYLTDNDCLRYLSLRLSDSPDVLIYKIKYEKKPIIGDFEDIKLTSKTEIDSMIFRLIKSEQINSSCNKLYKSDIIKNANIRFNSELLVGEDLLFNVEYINLCKDIYYYNKPLYFYRTSNSNSVTSNFMKTKYSNLMFVNDMMTETISIRYNKKLDNLIYFIRIKNILSCVRDLYSNKSPISKFDRNNILCKYKSDNPKIIVKNCGVKLFMLSIAFSYVNIIIIGQLISMFYGESK